MLSYLFPNYVSKLDNLVPDKNTYAIVVHRAVKLVVELLLLTTLERELGFDDDCTRVFTKSKTEPEVRDRNSDDL